MWFLHMGHGVGCLVVAGRARADSSQTEGQFQQHMESTSIPKDVTFASCTFVFVRKIGYPWVPPNQQFIIYHDLFPCNIANLSKFQIPHFCTDPFECDVS